VHQTEEACSIPVVAVRRLRPRVDDFPIVGAVGRKAHSASGLGRKSALRGSEAENVASEVLVNANQRREWREMGFVISWLHLRGGLTLVVST
jgi:hypothetical protein